MTEETEGVGTWFVAESQEVVVMFKFVIIFMLLRLVLCINLFNS